MRRFLILLLCCAMLTTVVFCADQASYIQSTANVESDGSCQVTLVATIHLDNANGDLTFPLPADAKNVRLNNSWVRTSRRANALEVDISKYTKSSAGDFTLTFTYSLPGVVKTEGELGQVLTLPLLCGFAYPVERLDFSVGLPGAFATTPTFSSGYYQESIESVISYTKNMTQNAVNGSVNQRLQDHETLTMRLLVPEELFLQSVTSVFSVGPYWIIAGALTALALLYWLLTLRAMPLRRSRCAAVPAGLTAGELGSRLVHKGADLTMMVLSWAQLGYLLITMDESGRVFLYKRMDMGNERSAFENHYFRALFKKRSVVDGAGLQYAQLCRRAAKEVPNARADFQSSSGNPKLFLGLCVAVGAVCGGAAGGAMAQSFAVRILLTILFAALGATASIVIHEGCKCFHLRNKTMLYAAAGSVALWVLVSILAGQWQIMLLGVGVQLLGGVANAYGGRRSELGKQTASEILGFRRYLATVTKEELQRILKVNPDYYHEMAPYALALGVDQVFATRFERLHQPNCTYLHTNAENNRTAADWNGLLRKVVDTLNDRQKRLRFEKLMR